MGFNSGFKGLSLRSSLLWYVTKRKLVFTDVSRRSIGPIFKGQAWHNLDDGTKTSVTNYQSTLRNISEERRSHLHRGESLKSQYSWLVCVCVRMCTTAQQMGYSFKPRQKPPLLEHQNKSGSATSGTDYSNKQTNRVIRLFLLLLAHTKVSLRLPISQVTEISTTLTLTQSC